MHHYRGTRKKYVSRLSKECPFCKPETIANAVYEDSLLYIVPNLTKYDLWELRDVTDHLLIIPKRHVVALHELNSEERQAVMDTIAKYDHLGYSVYARGVGVVSRSVPHQHTHLIKTNDKPARLSFFLKKPYLLIKK